MIKAAMQYITDLAAPKVITAHGSLYSDKTIKPIKPFIANAEPIIVSNLSSLLNYIVSAPDTMAEKMIIQVESPDVVRLFSRLDTNRERETMMIARAQVPSFRYERFVGHEEFTIAVQAKFVDDEYTDKALLLRFSGTVESGTVATYGDDGVSQKATVKTGIAAKSDAIVPNPVRLKPIRTFIEVDQPVSPFIFRMKDSSAGIECALFEADGGAWKNEAMRNIHDYIRDSLKQLLPEEVFKRFTFIS